MRPQSNKLLVRLAPINLISIMVILASFVCRTGGFHLLSWNFGLASFVFEQGTAMTLSWYFMNDWLQQYEYRARYVFAGALIITLITVSYQAVKAALTNPENSLRSE